MRAGVGFLSLLICVGIGAYIWSLSAKTAGDQMKDGGAVDQARQFSGHAPDGSSALDSVKTDGVNDGGGQFRALLVTDVTPGGVMEKFYGLKKGDKITEENQVEVVNFSDADMANKMLLDAYEKSAALKIIRNGVEMTLPQPAGASNTAAPVSPGTPAPQANTTKAQDAAPAAAPKGPRSQQQVIQDQIKQIGARPDPDGQ